MPTILSRPVPPGLGREPIDGAPPIINEHFRLEWAVATRSNIPQLILHMGNGQFTIDPHFAQLVTRCSLRVLNFCLSLVNNRCPMAEIGSLYCFDTSFDLDRANSVPGFPAHFANLNVERDILAPPRTRSSWPECIHQLTQMLNRLELGLQYISNLFDVHGEDTHLLEDGNDWEWARCLSATGGYAHVNAIFPDAILTLPRPLWDALSDVSNITVRSLVHPSILSRLDHLNHDIPEDLDEVLANSDLDSDSIDEYDWEDIVPEEVATPPPSSHPSSPSVALNNEDLPLPNDDLIVMNCCRSATPSPEPLHTPDFLTPSPLVATVRFARVSPQELITPPPSPVLVSDEDHPEGQRFIPVTLSPDGNLVNFPFIQEAIQVAFNAGKKEGHTSAVDELICAAEGVTSRGSGSAIDPILIDEDDNLSIDMSVDSDNEPSFPALEVVTHPVLGRNAENRIACLPRFARRN